MLSFINCAFDIVAGNHFHVCGFDGVTEVFFPSFLASDTFDSLIYRCKMCKLSPS